MKEALSITRFCLVIACMIAVSSCKKEEDISSFDYEKAEGIWVTHQIEFPDGSLSQGPVTSVSIFGTYAGSVQINKDKTFIPVIWDEGTGNYTLIENEKGSLKYISSTKKLKFEGGSFKDFEFEVVKVEGESMYLNENDYKYKLTKEK